MHGQWRQRKTNRSNSLISRLYVSARQLAREFVTQGIRSVGSIWSKRDREKKITVIKIYFGNIKQLRTVENSSCVSYCGDVWSSISIQPRNQSLKCQQASNQAGVVDIFIGLNFLVEEMFHQTSIEFSWTRHQGRSGQETPSDE
jgi:hypothetical protein